LRRGLTYDQLRSSADHNAVPRQYTEPLVDPRLPLLVIYVRSLPIAAGRGRLERLRDEALIQTLFSTGMRRDEVSVLNRQDLSDGTVDRAIVTTRSRKRMIFFDEASLEAIRAYLEARHDQYAPLFLRHDNHRGRSAGRTGERWRLSPHSVWAIVKRYAREVDISATTRDFRNAKALTLLERGASLSQVRDILGQSSVEAIWSRYRADPPRDLREVFDRYSSSAEELVTRLESDET
jgi:site-specific recombinase XerD